MAWINTTRWLDNNEKNINAVLSKLENVTFENSINDTVLYEDFQTEKAFPENQTFTFYDKEYEFNHVTYSFKTIRAGDEPIDERTQPNNGFIIIYFDGTNINYIINRNSDALKTLRMLLGYDGNLKIVQNNMSYNDDLFMWFIKRVFVEENSFAIIKEDQSEKILKINSIIGVRGETQDLINRVSAQGNTVMNLISTLSFIIESGSLKHIILRLEYEDNENIEVRLNDKKVIAVDIDTYTGVYEDEGTRELLESNLLLLVYLDIMPKFLNFFEIDKNEDEWNADKKRDFYELVSDKLLEKINEVSGVEQVIREN